MSWAGILNLALLAILVICLLPLAAIFWSTGFAAAHDCALSENAVSSCIVNGRDYGPWLGLAFVSGWLLILTLPIAAASAAALLIFNLTRLARRHLRRRKGA